MFGRFRKQKHKSRCGRHPGRHPGRGAGVCCARPISDFANGAEVVVLSNSDKQTLEMGIFSGVPIHIIKNRLNDSNMLVAVGESRYIIPKEAAAKIKVR